MTKETRPLRSVDELTTLNEVLAEQGTLEAFQAVAIKEVLAWQIAEAMKEQHITQRALAAKMGTSRSQVSRLLNPKEGNVTLETLQRAAHEVGRRLRIELV